MERLKSLVVYVTVSVFVLLAVAATVMRLAVAYAPELRAETESYLGEWLGRPVHIGGLRAEWQGLDPRLIFEDVTVDGEGSSRYSFAELEVAFSLRALVREARVVPSEVAVVGVELTVERLPSGELELSADRAPSFLATLPARIRVKDAVVRVIDHVRADVYALTGAQLLFQREPGNHSLSVAAELPRFLGERAEFILRWSRFQEPFADARLYADLHGVRFAAVEELGLAVRAIPGVRGAGDMELWFRARQGRVDEASGRISLQRLGAEQEDGKDWFDIGRKLEARFDWRRTGEGWALDVDEIGYAVGESLWPTSGLSVRYARQTRDRPERWRAGVEYIELSRLRQLLANLPRIPEAVQDWAEAVEMGGELRQAGLQAQLRDGRVVGYSARGTLTGGRYATGDGDMAVSGLDASFTANERGGEARINGRDGRLKLARLFRAALPYQRFEAEAAWARDPGGWRLGLHGVSLRNADGAVRGSIRLFDLGSGNPFIDIRASAQRFNAAATARYMPVGIMEDDLVAWLDQALDAGRLESGEMLFHGRAEDFPFRGDGSGVFEVRGRVADAQLSFFPEWPKIRDVTADLRFTGTGMEVSAVKGRILGAAIERAVARIDSFRDARLTVDGVARGPGNDYLAFLQQAPITRELAPTLRQLRLTGRHRLDIDLRVPLKRSRESQVDGRLRLSDGTLSVPGSGITVSGLTGIVAFDEQGVAFDGLTGQWRGHQVRFDAATTGSGSDTTIRVSAAATVAPQAVMPEIAPYLSGQARWRAQARFPGFQAGRDVDRIPVQLRSDLVGLGVRLPAPLGKDPAATRELRADFALSGEGVTPVTVAYGDATTVRADLTGDDGARYGVRFGDGQPELPEAPGIRLGGRIEELVLDTLPRLDPGGAPAPDGNPLRAWVDVSVGRLVVGGQDLKEVGVLGTLGPEGLSLRLSGPAVAGEVRVPPAEEAAPAKVQLQHLHLSKETVSSGSDTAGSILGPGGADDWPSVDVSIDELFLDQRPLGRFTAVVEAGTLQTRLKRFQLENPAIRIQGSGGWRRTGVAGRTSVEASFESDQVGKALALFGYAKTVQDGESEGRLRLEWAGGPLSATPAKLNGELEFTLSNGQLPAVEPGAGRVFGLLSLATIPRRLTLDFSDLFQEGFSFDEIKAHFVLKEGIAEPKLFFIEGPAARIDFSGQIDLVEQRFDQVLTITPQVSSTLPLIGGLTGGPVAAVVLFVTQQIFQEEMDSLAQYRYRVTGPWRDPKIEPIRRTTPESFEDFNSGG